MALNIDTDEEMIDVCHRVGKKDNLTTFINEPLSPTRRQQSVLARDLKKRRSIKYLWLRSGTIVMRATDCSPAIGIQ
ncbi:hypothetical protein J6590_088666 [Homalodisca vitripennis]|nr:hypothetical protein J6590_088666 [Homalodisca vitripennis]